MSLSTLVSGTDTGFMLYSTVHSLFNRWRECMGENRTVESPAKGSEKRIAELERSVMSFERKSQFFEMLIRSLPGVFYVI